MIITGILLVIVLLSILFIIIGMCLNNNFLFANKKNIALQYTVAYFTGMALFLSVWRIISYLINSACSSLYLTILICCVVIFILRRSIVTRSLIRLFVIIKKRNLLILGMLSFVFLFTLLYWITPFDKLNAFTLIGSLHSPRYANLATYILYFDRIPIVGQNYGQSMLTTIPMIFGLNKPLLTLNLWLSVTLVNLVFLTYSLFRYVNLRRKYALLGSIVVLFGNTAISFVQVLVIDSGSPFICNGYTDSISSIGTFVLFIFYLSNIFRNIDDYRISIKDFLVLFMLAVYWNIASPQNILFAFTILSILILKGFINIKYRRFKYTIIKITTIFILFNIVGVSQGGMYCPTNFKDKIYIPGMMDVKEKSRVGISPGIPYHIGLAGAWENRLQVNNSNFYLRETLTTNKSNPIKKALKSIYLLELILMESLKVVFWPLLGIIGLYVSVRKYLTKKCDIEHTEVFQKYYALLYCSIFTFAVGFVLTLFFEVSGYKWELSRFLILGYFFGMVCLVVLFDSLNNKNLLNRKLILLMLLIILIGPVLNTLVIITKNLFYLSDSLVFFERLDVMLNTTGMIR